MNKKNIDQQANIIYRELRTADVSRCELAINNIYPIGSECLEQRKLYSQTFFGLKLAIQSNITIERIKNMIRNETEAWIEPTDANDAIRYELKLSGTTKIEVARLATNEAGEITGTMLSITYETRHSIDEAIYGSRETRLNLEPTKQGVRQ